MPFAGIAAGLLPALSLTALLPVPLALYSLLGAVRHRGRIGDFPRYLGANVAAAVLTPLLLGVPIAIC